MGYPDDPDAIRRPSMSDQLMDTMFAPLPSGPQTEPRTRAMNSFNAYCAWKRSAAGGKAFGWMLMESRRLLAAGVTRISAKALVEEYRAKNQVDCNNTFSAWIADDLVAADPGLLPLIERRQRRKARA